VSAPGRSALRVLHLIPSLGGAGAERQLVHLCGGLRRLRHDVHVAFAAGGPNALPLERTGAAIHRLAVRGSYDVTLPLRVLSVIRTVSPDLVQTWLPMMDVLGGAAARLSGVPWILSERNTPDHFPQDLKIRVRARLARGAAAIVSNSESGDAYWSRLAPAVPRHVVRNGLALHEIDAAPARPASVAGVPDSAPLVLAVCKFKPQKNVWVMLDALERVVRATPAFALVCGEGELHAEAVRRLRDKGLADRILAPGFVGDVWSWMNRAQVFVSVSRFEGMPNAVMEAMACGTPLVLSDIAMHREIVDGDAALFVDDRPEAIADAIRTALVDPVGARARADAARKLAQAWSIDAAASRYAEIYAAVAGAPR
jgi:glycosyltransferase involved in cell wall biosynthesis